MPEPRLLVTIMPRPISRHSRLSHWPVLASSLSVSIFQMSTTEKNLKTITRKAIQVGSLKPQAEIYRAAIEAAQCSAGECFFTDDIPEYVEGARQFGIDAVQFESREQIERELRARGII